MYFRFTTQFWNSLLEDQQAVLIYEWQDNFVNFFLNNFCGQINHLWPTRENMKSYSIGENRLDKGFGKNLIALYYKIMLNYIKLKIINYIKIYL